MVVHRQAAHASYLAIVDEGGGRRKICLIERECCDMCRLSLTFFFPRGWLASIDCTNDLYMVRSGCAAHVVVFIGCGRFLCPAYLIEIEVDVFFLRAVPMRNAAV